MPFQIVRNDITKMKVDAVINTANPRVAYGRGTDQAIYQAAGKEKLLTARQKIGTMQVGEAAVTPGVGRYCRESRKKSAGNADAVFDRKGSEKCRGIPQCQHQPQSIFKNYYE